MLVVPSLKRAGAERQAVDLANGLDARGHQVTLCVFEQDTCQVEDLSPSIRFCHFPRRAKFDLRPIWEIARVIDQDRIEVVQGILQFAALFSRAAALLSDIKPPVLASIHTTKNIGVKEEIQDRLLYRHLLGLAPAVIFVSEYQRDYWVGKYRELAKNSTVVHNGIDVVKFQRSPCTEAAMTLRNQYGIAESDFVFACIAGFRREKGHEILINAFAQMPRSSHLLLAGDGRERKQIEHLVREAALQERVHFLGTVKDVRPVISASDVTVLPSTAVETFSIAMLESFALRVPMIASDIGGLAEAIIHGKTGLLVKPGDTDALVAQMRFALMNRSMLTEMGTAASELVATRFTRERMTEANEAILKDVIRSQHAGLPFR